MYPDTSYQRVATQSLMRYGPEAYRASSRAAASWRTTATCTRIGNEQSPEKEFYWLQRGSESIRRATGKKPTGYRVPWFEYSEHTTDFLAQEGFLYGSTLMGDDVPYVLQAQSGELIELPFHWAMDDSRSTSRTTTSTTTCPSRRRTKPWRYGRGSSRPCGSTAACG